ncbi:unnamed protein product [Paramecium sonneborni]|uniref:Uncharacterized protein n=1 Tax=Paramecium sonneborni TaxID=65129 RepID=A0A8S1QD24_9CILI|nr:unnamed protein product [Paramecium sonneborni]
MIIQLPQNYSLQLVSDILQNDTQIQFEEIKVEECRESFQTFIKNTKQQIYGFNTLLGFKMPNPIKDLQNYETQQLQELFQCIPSDPPQFVNEDLCKITLFILINNLVNCSGVSLNTLKQLQQHFNNKTHLQLPSINFNTQYYDASLNWAILSTLKNISEYDAIIITFTKSLSFATLLYNTYRSFKCIKMAFITTSISFEATNGVICAFTQLVNEVKQHQGQIEVAQELYNLLTLNDEESDLNLSLKTITHNILQDAYSTRCIPQVIGASLDSIKFIINTIQSQQIGQRAYQFLYQTNSNHIQDIIYNQLNNNETELLLLDYLAIAVSEIGAITERRIQRLMNPQLTKLQDYYDQYLRDDQSLFGFQQLANQASNLIQKNKKYCHPVSADSMPQTTHLEDINNNFEDSILKMQHIINNTIQILAIDMFLSSRIIQKLEAKEGKLIHTKLNNIVQQILPIQTTNQVTQWLEQFIQL